MKEIPSAAFFDVLSCSYRGYGRSQGQPNEAGIKLDAQAALDHLLERKDVNKDLVMTPPVLPCLQPASARCPKRSYLGSMLVL